MVLFNFLASGIQATSAIIGQTRSFGFGGFVLGYWFFIPVLTMLLLAIVVAALVYRDATALRAHGRGTFLCGPTFWAILAFVGCIAGGSLGPVVVVAIYWLIHHSSLRPQGMGARQVPAPSPSSPEGGALGGIAVGSGVID